MNALKYGSLLLLLFFAGCAAPPKKPKVSPTTPSRPQIEQLWQQHQQRLSALPNWQAQGRLAAVQGQKGGNASFVWEQRGEAYRIKLFGPFGAGAVYITGTPNNVVLKEANGKVTHAASGELLLQKLAGWTVPVTGLRYWLRGLPLPEAQPTQTLFNMQGQLSYLQQQDWKISYDNYVDRNQLPLPSRLQLQRDDIKLKMIVTAWQEL